MTKSAFNKRTIRVGISCCWRCPGTSTLSSAHLTVSLFLYSSRSNARGELRALERRHVSSKSLSRVRDGDEGVARRNLEEKSFSPMRGHWFSLEANQRFFTQKKSDNNWVSGQTWPIPWGEGGPCRDARRSTPGWATSPLDPRTPAESTWQSGTKCWRPQGSRRGRCCDYQPLQLHCLVVGRKPLPHRRQPNIFQLSLVTQFYSDGFYNQIL